MKPGKLFDVLKMMINANLKALIVGAPGIGKTAIIKSVCEELKSKLVLMHPSISDPTDFKGFPSKDESGKKAVFLPFGGLAELMENGTEENPEEKIVCFFDDLGQSPESVQKALMQLIHGGSINGLKIKKNVVFIGATNDLNQKSGVTGLIEPVKSRFDSIIHLEVNIDDWTPWAFENKMPVELIAYLRSSADKLIDFHATKELKNSPCPRTWESVGKFMNAGIFDREIFAGAIGEGTAVEFMAFLELAKEAPNLDAILINPETERIPEKPSLKYLVANAIAKRSDEKTISQFMKYLNRMEKQFRVMALKTGSAINPEILKTQTFINWVRNEGKDCIPKI